MITIASALLAASTMAGNLDSLYSSNFEPFNCPAGQLGTSSISWRSDGMQQLDNVDVTQFQNIWGRTSPTDNIVPFPGDNITAYLFMNRAYFIAARFVVPSDSATTTHGGFAHGSTNAGPALDMSMSSQCGDFAPSGQSCKVSNKSTGQPMVQWKIAGGSGSQCSLTPGQTYYVNVRLTNPNVTGPNCGAPGTDLSNLCVSGIINNVTR